MANDQVSWHGSEPFYDHLRVLWDFEAKRRYQLNESMDPVESARLLEDWFEVIDTMYGRILYFLDKEEKVILDDMVDKIDKITEGQQFAAASLDASDLKDIKIQIRLFSREIFIYMGKYKMLLPTHQSPDPHKALQNS